MLIFINYLGKYLVYNIVNAQKCAILKLNSHSVTCQLCLSVLIYKMEILAVLTSQAGIALQSHDNMRQGPLHRHGTCSGPHSPKSPKLHLMICCCHIKILINFIFELVFCNEVQWGDGESMWVEKTYTMLVCAFPCQPTHSSIFDAPWAKNSGAIMVYGCPARLKVSTREVYYIHNWVSMGNEQPHKATLPIRIRT